MALTKAQVTALLVLSDESGWLKAENSDIRKTTLDALVALGFVETRPTIRTPDVEYRITEQGRRVAMSLD